MNAMQMLKTRRQARRNARNRAEFFKAAGDWALVTIGAVVAFPTVAAFAWMIGTTL